MKWTFYLEIFRRESDRKGEKEKERILLYVKWNVEKEKERERERERERAYCSSLSEMLTWANETAKVSWTKPYLYLCKWYRVWWDKNRLCAKERENSQWEERERCTEWISCFGQFVRFWHYLDLQIFKVKIESAFATRNCLNAWAAQDFTQQFDWKQALV